MQEFHRHIYISIYGKEMAVVKLWNEVEGYKKIIGKYSTYCDHLLRGNAAFSKSIMESIMSNTDVESEILFLMFVCAVFIGIIFGFGLYAFVNGL